jgi:DNA-binding FadR family transcriptional regulator
MKKGETEQSPWSAMESEFPPIVKIDITEEIIGRIKALLAKGRLKAGSRLPPERDLARILGVGRPALRQALKALATMGIIDSRVGQGTFISRSTWELLAAPMDFMMLLNVVSIRELFEVRKALEVELAGLAAERATDDDLSHINAVLRKQEISLANPQAFLEGDLEFHAAIAAASRNILFLAILDNLSRLMIESRQKLLLQEQDLSLSFKDHQRICAEIAAKNTLGAREAMLRHLDRVYHYWEDTQRLEPEPSLSGSEPRHSNF